MYAVLYWDVHVLCDVLVNATCTYILVCMCIHELWCCVPTDWVCTGQQHSCNAVSASSTFSGFSLSNICLDNTVTPSKSAHTHTLAQPAPDASWRHLSVYEHECVTAAAESVCIGVEYDVPTKHWDGLGWYRMYLIIYWLRWFKTVVYLFKPSLCFVGAYIIRNFVLSSRDSVTLANYILRKYTYLSVFV